MKPSDTLIILRAIKLGASLEVLIAKGYSYSQIASTILSLRERGLILSETEKGLVVSESGLKLLNDQPKEQNRRTNAFIAPANAHRIKQLDANAIYVPHRSRSSFFKQQGHQN